MEKTESKMSKIINVVRAVEAIQRIPKGEFPLSTTFFSVHDVWRYVGVMDGRICSICRDYEEHGEFTGNMLRSLFPFLEIMDVDLIRVNAHMPRDDNCRCYLERVIEVEK